MINFFKDNRIFVKRTVAVMVPVILQNLLIYFLNMMDSVMLSSYSQSDFAASSLANQGWFIYTLFAFGLSSGTCILTSQYYGKKDGKSINAVMHIGFLASFIVSAAFASFLFFFPKSFMTVYAKEAIHIELGAKYLRIVAPSYLLTSFTVLYSNYLKSIEKAVVPLIFNGISLVMNTVLNYVFIFGIGIINPMGIEGAAIATLIARIAEFIIMTVYFSKFELYTHIKVKLHDMKIYVKDFFRYSIPIVINESLWGIGISIQTAVFGRMGETVVNAISVNSIVERTGLIVCMGLYQAASVLLGIELGKNNFDTAKKYSRYYLIFSMIFGIVFGIIIYFAYPFICFMFNMPSETRAVFRGICTVLAILLVVKSINVMGICSILRSGGDSRAALLIDVSVLLFITNPLGAYLALGKGLSPTIVYFVFISEEFIKMPIMLFRIKQEKWVRNITVE